MVRPLCYARGYARDKRPSLANTERSSVGGPGTGMSGIALGFFRGFGPGPPFRELIGLPKVEATRPLGVTEERQDSFCRRAAKACGSGLRACGGVSGTGWLACQRMRKRFSCILANSSLSMIMPKFSRREEMKETFWS